MIETKSYYAIIPANVRYDKELTANAKLLYGEITALCNEKGYCWASNSYFSELYSVSKVSISKWINQLIEKGYLGSEIIYKEGSKEILNRYLRIVNDPIKEKFNTPIKEKFKDNNTVFNNTINNNNNAFDFKNLFDYYISLNLIKHKNFTKAMENAIKKAMRENKYTIEDCKILLDRHKQVVELSKSNEFKVPARGLDEFFGQKVFNASHLICSEYEEGGAKYERYLKTKEVVKEEPKSNPIPREDESIWEKFLGTKIP